MAANAIGAASVVLSANADQLASGLDRAQKDINKWSDDVEKQGRARGGRGGLLGGLIGGVGGLALGAIGAGVGAVALGATVALRKYGELKEGIDRASKAARAFGTDMATWQGIEHAAGLAGVGVEELSAGMGFFRRQVEGPLDEALFGLARRLEGIEDPGERARVLVENFGRSGLKLTGLFEEGEEGLKGMVAEAEKLGFALSDADGKAIEEANDSIERAKKAVEGLWNRIVVALAPAFDAIGKAIAELAPKFAPVFDFMSRYTSAVLEVMIPLLGEVVTLITEVIDTIGEWVGEMLGMSGVTISVRDVVLAAFRVMGYAAAAFWDVLKAGAGVMAIVAGTIVRGFSLLVDVFKEVVSLAKELPDELRPDGLDAFIAGTDKFAQTVNQVGKEIQGWGVSAVMSFGDSFAAIDRWFDKIGNKAEEAKKKAGEMPLLGPPPVTIDKFAGAFERGTKEAYSIVTKFQAGNLTGPGADVPKRQLEEQRKANQHLKKIDEKFDKVFLDTI